MVPSLHENIRGHRDKRGTCKKVFFFSLTHKNNRLCEKLIKINRICYTFVSLSETQWASRQTSQLPLTAGPILAEGKERQFGEQKPWGRNKTNGLKVKPPHRFVRRFFFPSFNDQKVTKNVKLSRRSLLVRYFFFPLRFYDFMLIGFGVEFQSDTWAWNSPSGVKRKRMNSTNLKSASAGVVRKAQLCAAELETRSWSRCKLYVHESKERHFFCVFQIQSGRKSFGFLYMILCLLQESWVMQRV